jgi:ketosteroid isomerase-like protein
MGTLSFMRHWRVEKVSGFWSRILCGVVLAGLMAVGSFGQSPKTGAQSAVPDPPAHPAAKTGKMLLLDLEARFAKDVLERGGAAFADWFAEDGVTLSNGQAPVIGRVAIAKSARWLPNDYQLAWTPTDAVMGPSGDIGYTWGIYTGHSKDANGNPVTTRGRYITIWRKQPDGSWKVALDAGANAPEEVPDCCKVPAANRKYKK